MYSQSYHPLLMVEHIVNKLTLLIAASPLLILNGIVAYDLIKCAVTSVHFLWEQAVHFIFYWANRYHLQFAQGAQKGPPPSAQLTQQQGAEIKCAVPTAFTCCPHCSQRAHNSSPLASSPHLHENTTHNQACRDPAHHLHGGGGDGGSKEHSKNWVKVAWQGP